MSTPSARKKSIVSSVGPSIDLPVANNTLLNKSASQSTSLYQQCSSLRARLLRIKDFPPYFALASPPDSSRQSTDPVTQLWDCFALGIPLCYLFNLLPPPITPINVNTVPDQFDVSNERGKKRAIALFSMQIRQLEDCEQFTVTDLYNRDSTDGFVKVVNTVTALVEYLPEEVFVQPAPSSPPSLSSAHQSTDSIVCDSPHSSQPVSTQEAARSNIIRELVETERKYVQDLEVMQRYSTSLSQSNTIDQDTIHLLFPNLNKLLNFQRRFLIKLEATAEQTWKDQRWGLHFTEMEDEFTVYEPYCANYTNASEIMLAEEQNLMNHNHLINAKSELPAFLIKPIQRICKYPLLLESLLKAASPVDYPYYDELKKGCASTKRITDKINEAQRRAENMQTVRNLESRIEDWKGHHISNFGELLLEDVFVVKKSDVDREYHVFLFQRIILCCKELVLQPQNAKKVGKSNSILKKQAPNTLQIATSGGPKAKKSTPLLLKGRIFLNNVTQATPRSSSGTHSLAVWWRGDDDLEFFTLRCRNEEQLRQWEAAINKLINETAARRASERPAPRLAPPQSSASTSPILQQGGKLSRPENGQDHRYYHQTSGHRQTYGDTIASPVDRIYGGGVQGYPSHYGFDGDGDDDYEEYPPSNLPSGRATPLVGRRSLQPDLHDGQYVTSRMSGSNSSGFAVTSMTSGTSSRPSTGRTTPSVNGQHDPRLSSSRPPLRSQFSSTKLRPETMESRVKPNVTDVSVSQRLRSLSQPTSYLPKPAAPPLPSSSPWMDTPPNGKRGSGSSQSSSDYSGHASPITPYGSSESSLLRGSRSQGFDNLTNANPNVKVKVHFNEDIFVIQVPLATEYSDLVERVGRKIRLCGPRRDDGPLRVKYRDDDGDLVSLGSTEDVQMAFEMLKPGGQVTLYVT
ncbi:hypothetical protein BDM02DRAFT_3261751 [Thelephora ganbajun]|uniref:Uncharacterized protein n=1 Tax=Thelephora ganbajun TaxID=370292 RepID=A0ACB6ZCN3_THEGA|nr:hypothetical protein BDM02DRAFT_3261751 [Thelephora ganbajun]